jgi:hypothetical protein
MKLRVKNRVAAVVEENRRDIEPFVKQRIFFHRQLLLLINPWLTAPPARSAP